MLIILIRIRTITIIRISLAGAALRGRGLSHHYMARLLMSWWMPLCSHLRHTRARALDCPTILQYEHTRTIIRVTTVWMYSSYCALHNPW